MAPVGIAQGGGGRGCGPCTSSTLPKTLSRHRISGFEKDPLGVKFPVNGCGDHTLSQKPGLFDPYYLKKIGPRATVLLLSVRLKKGLNDLGRPCREYGN